MTVFTSLERARGSLGDHDSGQREESSARTQLKRELRQLSYAEQCERVRPPMPVQYVQPLSPDGSSPLANVQRAGGSAESATAVKQAAAEGVSGSGGSLPYLETIERSFGGHDVGSIRAHIGGAAARANETIGSRAYASGHDIAFKSAPDLHTVAHEAAHVVQQRSGVSLPNGVGQVGDAYEKHADAVADRVVSGRSAAALLSEGGSPTQAVQRSVQMEGGGTGPLPEETWEEIGGVERRLVISHEGGVPKVVQHPGFTPIQIAASTRKPFEIASSIERLTARYLDESTPETEKPKILSTIKAEMTKLRMAMVKARGLNQAPIALRDQLEVYLGQKIQAGAGAFGAGNASINEMVLEAGNLLRTKFADEENDATSIQQVFAELGSHPEFKTAIEAHGISVSTGFAGVRGASFDAVKAILEGGTLDEKVVTLHTFGGKFLGGELVARGEVYTRIAERLDSQWLTALSNSITSGKTGNKLMEFPAVCEDYRTAKAQDMDRKMPAQPVENLTLDQLKYLANKIGVDISEALAQGTETEKLQAVVSILKGRGIHTSREGGLADATAYDTALGHLNGSVENLLKLESDFVREATTTLRMPLKAGISGTTQRVCGLGVLLGVSDVSRVRLAMIGHLQNIQAHSFHEVMVAASGYPGCADYEPGKYVPNSPVGQEIMLEEAKKFLATQPALLTDCTGESDTELQAEVMLGIKPFPSSG
jgi:hypothetical protein